VTSKLTATPLGLALKTVGFRDSLLSCLWPPSVNSARIPERYACGFVRGAPPCAVSTTEGVL